MKHFLKISFIVITIISIASCDSVDFGDTNTNPNNPSVGSTATLMTGAQKYIGHNYATSPTPNLYVQYLANGDYDDQSRYLSFNFSYNTEYATVLRNIKEVIDLCDGESTKSAAGANGSVNNQKAVAKIMRAYMFWTMTDRWGMLPYSEAIQGIENSFPKFDSQEDIYTGCFTEIDEALAMIDSGNGPTGDIIFDGSMTKWTQFANTLRVVMALRISRKVPASTGYAAAEFNKGIAGSISSNSENLSFSFLTEDSNDNPWEDRFESRKDWVLADTFVDALIGTGTNVAPEDPRLAKYGELSSTSLVYVGGVYGETNNTANFSFITDNIINSTTAPAMLFTYSQVAFAKAEAVTLGWYAGSASAFYDTAIQASMDQWGVDGTDAATYIAGHPYASVTDIAQQKWVSMFLQGYESWAEWRRYEASGVAPTLKSLTNAINGTGIPQRHAYPGSAPTLNEAAYNAAVTAQGADDLDTKLWWAN